MAKYKGKYIATIKAEDVGWLFRSIPKVNVPLGYGWGMVRPVDVGKDIYVHNGRWSIENTDQMLARLADSATAGL